VKKVIRKMSGPKKDERHKLYRVWAENKKRMQNFCGEVSLRIAACKTDECVGG
jgi:hypothetical protein